MIDPLDAAAEAAHRSCPFFAHALLMPFGRRSYPVLVSNPGSNQCALITNAHSPCVMQLAGDVPSWFYCKRNPENNGTGHADR